MSQMNPTAPEVSTLAKEFILHGDQVRAWRITYPNSKAVLNTQYSRASVVFKTKKVQKRIKELTALSKKGSDKDFNMTVTELKKALAIAIKKGLSEKTDAQGNTVAHSISGAVSAIGEFNKMDGNHAPTKTDLSINPNDVTPWSDVKANIDK